MTTRNDIAWQVSTTLGEFIAFGFDIDGITAEIVQRYGFVDIDEIPSDDYNEMIARYDTTKEEGN